MRRRGAPPRGAGADVDVDVVVAEQSGPAPSSECEEYTSDDDGAAVAAVMAQESAERGHMSGQMMGGRMMGSLSQMMAAAE